MNDYEIVTSNRAPKRKGNTISVTKQGFRFNSGFIETEELSNHTAVQILYKKLPRKGMLETAFKFLMKYERSKGNRIRRLTKRGAARVVKPSNFYETNNIDVAKALGKQKPVRKKHKKWGYIYVIKLPIKVKRH